MFVHYYVSKSFIDERSQEAYYKGYEFNKYFNTEYQC